MSASGIRQHHLLVCALLAAPLAAQRAWLDWLPQTEEVVHYRTIDLSPFVESVLLPGDGPIRGIAHRDGLVWLARDDTLFAFDPVQAKVIRQRALPEGLLGLSADAQSLYVLTKDAVQVFDGMAKEKVRELALPAREKRTSPSAIGCHGDAVYVAIGRQLLALDRQSGEARELPGWPTALQWLASDGKVLWGGDTDKIPRVVVADAKASEAQASRSQATSSQATSSQASGSQKGEPSPSQPRPVMRSSGTFVGDRLLCAFDWVNDGGAMQQAAGYVRLGASDMPTEELELKIYKDQPGVKYELGPKPLRTLALLKLELTRIAQDPSVMIAAPNGKRVMMPITLKAYPGVLIRDLAAAWDVATACGFSTVYCTQDDIGRRNEEPPPPPPPPPPVEKGR